MISNYFKIALRSLQKNKIYSIINILGLSIGIASCLVILLHVEDEFSYDKFHSDSDRIYKVVLERIYPDHFTNYAIIPHSFGEVMVNDFPEVENMVRMTGGGNNNQVLVRYINENNEEKAFEETNFIAADSTFFDIFSLKLIKGNPEKALSIGQNVIVSESTAKKYFEDADPIGKILKTDFGDFTVSGVMEDVPENSHFDIDFLTPIKSIPFFNNQNFTGFSAHLYIKLKKGASPEQLLEKFPKMVERYAGPQIEQNLNKSYEEYVKAGNGYNYKLIPLDDIHLHPVKYQNSYKAGGDINDVYTFLFIAFLILLIACINFMNLATARSTERAREVGIRKALGSARSFLIGQFLVESIVVCLFATIIAVGIAYVALPFFNTLANKNLVIDLTGSYSILFVFLFSILVGIISGLYPAFVLSGFNPVDVLKGKMATNKSSALLRNGLVVLQFSISIVLISATLIVSQQLNFVKDKDLGYDKSQVLLIERANILENNLETFTNEIRQLQNVKSVGASNIIPVNQFFGIQFVPYGGSEVITTNAMSINDDYISTMDMKILAGRGFSRDFNDSLSIVVNEKAAALFMPEINGNYEELIGMKINNTAGGDPPVTFEYEIIGVVKDFHYMNLRNEISPFVLLSTEGPFGNFTGFISVRIDNEHVNTTIANVEAQWKKFVPSEPFKYSFLDQELYNQYKTEETSGKIFMVFAVLAIIIACVGLFGLAAYIAGLRTKEIGVRKVLGASVFSVVLMLTKDFTKLIAISLVIAIPTAWYFMNMWLDTFAYRIEISVMTFIIAGLVALFIAWFTVSYQSIKAAIINPVRSLRSE